MEKKIVALLVMLLILVFSAGSGCIDRTEERTTVSVDASDVCDAQSGDVSVIKTTKIVFGMPCEETVIVGRLISITFNSQGPDVLVFQKRGKGESKAVFCARRAEDFDWVVGENCKVIIKRSALDGKAEVTEVSTVG